MPFQLSANKSFTITTSRLGVLLFPPFLAGTLVDFETALGKADATPDAFIRHFTAIEARRASDNGDDIELRYKNGERVEINAIQPEDVGAIANVYLKNNESEMSLYASGDQVIKLEDNKWQPSQNVARMAGESDEHYFRRLAQECVNQSKASLNQIKESFRSIVGIGSTGRFALADLNATLSANRIRSITSSPVIQMESIKPDQVGFAHPRPRPDDTLAKSLEQLINEVQRVSLLIAEQCESARNQNIKTDLLIEASNNSSADAVKSLKIADNNLKWAKLGIFATTIISLLAIIQSCIASRKQAVEELSRSQEAAQIVRLATSSQEALFAINKSLDEMNRRIKTWPGETKR